ncbi:carboxypeptidase-like regulatory domain-containing protein [Ottowia testudinis]|uniref:carboxypeptidase-like regulatory domain-containing protein n=1 Tax=Ottowia testudinis TaxID=2816950 RepID=UPI001FB07E5C|nr:carboxypeptidase-like regulatory domain-containing protein [Ottowia testudinis]
MVDGAYTLRAVATNTAGKTAQATRAVTVQKVIPPPPPPPPPYVVRNVSITPAVSFGTTPIQIAGEVVTNPGGELVPTAALRMILRVQGFERRLSLVSDAAGRFTYNFIPQANDAGTYEVRLVHPEDAAHASRPAHGNFTINRLGVNYAQYKLNAIRGFASSAVLQVTASAGTGATGVRWQAVPADQPSGSLPPGITLDAGTPIDIAAGTTVPTSIKLSGSASAGATGTVILKLFANESGATPRAELRLDYQLHEARPGITPEPTALEIGVQQTKTASGKLTLTNKGYSPAQGVRVQLLTREGGAPPAWASLASGADIGAIDIGQSTAIQVNARPGTDVADGYHQLQLKITADNDAGGSVPVTIAVARDGQGGVRFKLVDIYTNTLDAQGKPIEGLQNARITLQNEALTGDIRSASSNASGIAEFTAIPPGNYRWRASAPNHQDASGRITVSAGLTASERVFLDYQVVSIEFSVTETTIKDVYNITLEATYQTQVPAPVVLLEPMSINLPALQQGEEFTGELTLSNYGLVRADEVKFALPQSDENFKYEFFGNLPTQLAAKSRVSIPYRITSLNALKKGLKVNTQPVNVLEQLGAGYQPSAQIQGAIRQFLSSGDGSAMAQGTPVATMKEAAKAASCSSYQTQACVAYEYDCAAGDVRKGSTCSSISRVTGSACSGSGSAGAVGTSYCGTHNNWCGNGGGWGGAGWGGGAPMPLVPTCVPSCPDCSAGIGPAGG